MGGHYLIHCSSNPHPQQNKNMEEEQILFLLEIRFPSSSTLGHQSSWFLNIQTPGLTPAAPGTQAFGLRLNYTTSFPHSSTCRRQIVGLLSLHYWAIPIINLICNIGFTYIYIYYKIYISFYTNIYPISSVSLKNPDKTDVIINAPNNMLDHSKCYGSGK